MRVCTARDISVSRARSKLIRVFLPGHAGDGGYHGRSYLGLLTRGPSDTDAQLWVPALHLVDEDGDIAPNVPTPGEKNRHDENMARAFTHQLVRRRC